MSIIYFLISKFIHLIINTKNLNMKNLIYLTSVVLLASCGSNTNNVEDVKIGYEILESGEKVSLNAGDMSTIEVWEKYVEAHNNKDLETIKSLNHNDIKILTPGGEINTSEEHIKFLDRWFSENNPQWKTHYMIANELTENDTLKQYVTSCHELTLTVDTNQTIISQIHDAWIVDGKVKKFYVYEKPVSSNN